LVERRYGASQPVVLQIEHVQSPKLEKRDRNLAGDLVPGEVDDFEAVEGGEGGGKVAGEVVVVEEEGFEIEEAGEVGDLSGEGVALEAEHPELVELVEDIVIQNSGQVEVLQHQLCHPPLHALFHPFPLAHAAAAAPPWQRIRHVDAGFQREERFGVPRSHGTGKREQRGEKQEQQPQQAQNHGDSKVMQCGIFKFKPSLFLFHSQALFKPRADLLPPSITSTPKTKQGAKESFSRLFPFSFIPDLNAAKATAGNITLGGSGDPVKSKGSSTLPSTAFKGGERSSALGSHRMETVELASFLAKLTDIYSVSFT
jgi:hypothetical protein